jgi:hypothetical protein
MLSVRRTSALALARWRALDSGSRAGDRHPKVHRAAARARPAVTVTHRLENQGVWPMVLAPWALSQMRLEPGQAAIPVECWELHPVPSVSPTPDGMRNMFKNMWLLGDLTYARDTFSCRFSSDEQRMTGNVLVEEIVARPIEIFTAPWFVWTTPRSTIYNSGIIQGVSCDISSSTGGSSRFSSDVSVFEVQYKTYENAGSRYEICRD